MPDTPPPAQLPDDAITAEVRILAEEAFARLHSDRGYTLAQCLHAALIAAAPAIAARAAATEREACAQLAEREARAHRPAGGKALNIADRIRQRGAQ